MTERDRRSFLAAMLGGLAVASAGTLLVATPTQALPLPRAKGSGQDARHVERAQVVVGPRRRRRRWRCWWSRGRRVCGWRW
jgi:hypothetical protein